MPAQTAELPTFPSFTSGWCCRARCSDQSCPDLVAMPDSCFTYTFCGHCHLLRNCHMRPPSRIGMYTGLTCNECHAWNDIDEVHCQWSIRMAIADRSRTHTLTQLLHIGYDRDAPFIPIGHLIASFIAEPWKRPDPDTRLYRSPDTSLSLVAAFARCSGRLAGSIARS